MKTTSRLAVATMMVGLITTSSVPAVPVNSGGSNVISDRGSFIPIRKQQPLPGTLIGVLVSNAQPVLALEGRSGPQDQFCLSYNGSSYRWVYVPADKQAMIPRLELPVGTKGEKKVFERLNLASQATLKPLGIDSQYALVEVEVNGGLGAPAGDSFVATRIRGLDGTNAFPLKLDDVIADMLRRYQDHGREKGRDFDAAIERIASIAIRGKKATGPRERSDLVFVTWLAESDRLRVHCRSTITDGHYQYENGINIDVGRPRTMALNRPGNAAPRLPDGLRQGTQFGIEYGLAFEVSKSGKVERTLTLPIEAFQRELKGPGLFRSGIGTMRGQPPRTAAIRR